MNPLLLLHQTVRCNSANSEFGDSITDPWYHTHSPNERAPSGSSEGRKNRTRRCRSLQTHVGLSEVTVDVTPHSRQPVLQRCGRYGPNGINMVLLRLPLVHTAAVAAAALRLLHCQTNWAKLVTPPLPKTSPFQGSVSWTGREVSTVPRWWLLLPLRWPLLLLLRWLLPLRSLLLLLPLLLPLLLVVLSRQLRKLRPRKVVGRLDCVVSKHVPNSHRVVTVSLTQNQATLRPASRTAWRLSSGVITSAAATSLSLTHTLVAQARRPRGTADACRTRASKAPRGTGRWAGERSSNGLRLQSEWKGIGERRKQALCD